MSIALLCLRNKSVIDTDKLLAFYMTFMQSSFLLDMVIDPLNLPAILSHFKALYFNQSVANVLMNPLPNIIAFTYDSKILLNCIQ
jgi:hypothetical protein